MNCKPGDLAVVIHAGEFMGRIVSVMYAAPTSVDFNLPDGYPHKPCSIGDWIVDMGSPVSAKVSQSGNKRLAKFAVIQDRFLKPLRDNDGEDETLQWAPVPVKEIA